MTIVPDTAKLFRMRAIARYGARKTTGIGITQEAAALESEMICIHSATQFHVIENGMRPKIVERMFTNTMSNQFVSQTVRCAAPQCQHVRKEANHWFVVRQNADVLMILRLSGHFPFQDGDRPACGEQCVQKIIADWLAAKN